MKNGETMKWRNGEEVKQRNWRGKKDINIRSFRDLRVWQLAKEIAIKIYKMSSEGAMAKDFGLRDQMRRSAVSIASNIAEGYERYSNKDFVRFLLIAKGSLSELLAQAEIADGVGHLQREHFDELTGLCEKLKAMLTRLIQARMERVSLTDRGNR